MKKLLYLLLLTTIIYLVSCSSGKDGLSPQTQSLEDIIVGTEWCLNNENEDGFLLGEDGKLYITEKCQPNYSIGEWIIDGDIIKYKYIEDTQEITVLWAQISEYSDTIVKLFDINNNPTLTVVSVYQLDYEDIFGCTDTSAFNYNPNAECNSGDCIHIILGCTDATACNYDSLANTDDGSCIGLLGCIDVNACNYDASATCDDGSCDFPNGCTDITACNYDASATCDDGSCIIPDGCTENDAMNYNPSALCDDGSCVFDSGFCYYCHLNYTTPNNAYELEFDIGAICGDELTQLYQTNYSEYEVLEIIISGNDTLPPGIYGSGSTNSEYEIHCETHASHP